MPGLLEPNAGSDLASLQTRAVKDGDDYVVNGQKVWTSLAHFARLDDAARPHRSDAPKHKGITYFLLDMKCPGVTVQPLKQITGDAEFNEVYFDNVRVHESQILGGLEQRLGGRPHHADVRAAGPRLRPAGAPAHRARRARRAGAPPAKNGVP